MTDYIKPSSYRLPDNALAIIARIRKTSTPGRAVNSTDAVIIALVEWHKNHPESFDEKISRLSISGLQDIQVDRVAKDV